MDMLTRSAKMDGSFSSNGRLREEKACKQASFLRDKCPEWYVAMQDVALAQGWDPGAKRALLEQAVKFEPNYFYYYRKYAVSILPQWDGEEGQLEKFLQSRADQIGGDPGDILYFQVASLLGGCINQPLKLSWPRIQRGFDALERQSGSAPDNRNRPARLAAIFNDPAVANKIIARIGISGVTKRGKHPPISNP